MKDKIELKEGRENENTPLKNLIEKLNSVLKFSKEKIEDKKEDKKKQVVLINVDVQQDDKDIEIGGVEYNRKNVNEQNPFNPK